MIFRITRFIACCFVICLLLLELLTRVGAAEPALWGPNAIDPTVKVVDTNYTASQDAIYQCHDQDFILQTSSDIKHPFNPNFEDTTYTQCAFYTSFGLVSVNDSIFLNGTIQPYHISAQSINGNIIPTPNSDSLFIGGSSIYAYDSPAADFRVDKGDDYLSREITYKDEYYLRDGISPRVLRDSSGQTIQNIKHVKSSQNGQWLIAQKGTQLLRVRADDFTDLLAFPGDTQWYGQDPRNDMAISNDGRYVASILSDHLGFKLYDLSNCLADPNYNLTNATDCDPLDMVPFLQSHLTETVNRVDEPRFSSDDMHLSLRVWVGSGASAHTELVELAAPGAGSNQQATASNYIALGDSFASGQGAYDYFSGTDEAANKCHLSKRSYPYLLGLQLQLDSEHSVACSGAKMVNINGMLPDAAQYSARPSDGFSDYWVPGYSPQLKFIREKQPNIVTISMVGNDVGFADIIKACILTPDTCYAADAERLGFVKNINSKFDSLVTMYSQIRAAAAPNARIYVIGYPSIVKPDGNCADNVHLNSQETEFAGQLTDYLDYVIQQAATKAGVSYVNTQDSLDGYRLCENTSSVLAVNGLTAGNDTLYGLGAESYHPNAIGHQLLARSIGSLTNDMSKTDPAPDWSIKKPTITNAENYIDALKADQTAPRIQFDDDEPAAPLVRGAPLRGTLSSSMFHLDRMINYQIWIHSTPIKLGTAQSDADGNLTYTVTVPSDIEPGWHTVDIYGNDIAGHPVDIQRMVYVEASANDWDGDGIPNDREACLAVPGSGHDIDQDGIDDACDGLIAKPPLPAAPTVQVAGPINAAGQHAVAVSGSGVPGTTAHISIDDDDSGTAPVTSQVLLPDSAANTVEYKQVVDVSSLTDGTLTVSVKLSNSNGSSPATTANVIKDTLPPTFVVTRDPLANADGWNRQAVTLQLKASDSGMGVASLSYGTTGAQSADTQSLDGDTATLTIQSSGKTTVTYTATDAAGNKTTQVQAINIDRQPPITYLDAGQGPILFSIFGQTLTGTTSDDMSGTITTKATFTSKDRKISRTLKASCTDNCATWQVDTSRLPSGRYLVTAYSIDRAGNIGVNTSSLPITIVSSPWLWLWN